MIRFLGLALAVVLAGAMSASAKIKIWTVSEAEVAAGGSPGGADFGDTTLCAGSTGGAATRYVGIKCIINGNYKSDTGCIDNINASKGSGALLNAACVNYPSQYLVYGLADSFVVPASDTFMIKVTRNVRCYILIDGKLLRGEGTLTDFPRDSIGTNVVPPTTLYETSVYLSQGNHKFEFFYYSSAFQHESVLQVSWKSMSQSSYSIIPASVFGSNACVACNSTGASNFSIEKKASQNNIELIGNSIIIKGISGKAPVSIFDLRGNKVNALTLESTLSGATLDLAKINLSKGVYFIRIANGKKVESVKIIKK